MKQENILHIFSHMPVLETDRLLLRPMRVSDAQDMYEYASNPDVTRYLLWRPHDTPSYTRSYLEYLGGRYRLGSCREWAVILKSEGRMIGTSGFAAIDCPNRVGELGYVLNPAYRGQGFSPEAARRVISFGFDVLGLHRIEARYMIGNDASQRVMEKIGMRYEGVRRESMLVKGAYRDIGICAILVSEYRAAKAQGE